ALAEQLLDFIECSIHCTLFARKLYPPNLFEPRMYQGVALRQSRHPDINTYIRRVLNNTKPLLEQGLVERVVLAITAPDGSPADYLTIKCTAEGLSLVAEELRGTVLRILTLDALMPPLPPDCTWSLLVVT
ncbi:DNA-binding protein, partial [Ochromonadaceae sp. CCMP2298]